MEVKTITVVGAGPAGRRLAQAAASAGFFTVLEDISPEKLSQGIASIRQSLDEAVVRGEVAAAFRNKTFALLSVSNRVEEAIRDADLIIEAVPDELEMKLELFTIFDKFAKPGAIFASNASSLHIADLSDMTVYRERCVGLRFSSRDADGEQMEIVKAAATSEETVEACSEVARRMAKRAVLIESSPCAQAPQTAETARGA
jgi:3-hydroxyacyl-CoA dehydrogenase